MMNPRRAAIASALAGAMIMVLTACGQQGLSRSAAPGVVIQPSGKTDLGAQISAAASSVSARPMQGCGLAGAVGGVHVKALKAGTHDLVLPMPQLADGQVPVCYYISTTPEQALAECRLQERAAAGVFVNVTLKATQNQEIQIDWASVVLIASKATAPSQTQPEQYLPATACVQSDAKEVKELADKLWPGNGKLEDYARNIQGFIRDMKQKEQPQAMDALGILKSGGNWICTANANLAAALMRSKRVPCRSIAVIPPMSRRLEMHRVVEYFEDGKWVPFDPSLLQADIPLKPWQSIIMAKTTIPDENTAMTPRFGSALGCPFGQEVEFATFGLTLSGNDFYWTLATPLAEFEVSDEAIALTVAAWKQYLQSGTLSPGQIKAASAKGLKQYVDAMETK